MLHHHVPTVAQRGENLAVTTTVAFKMRCFSWWNLHFNLCLNTRCYSYSNGIIVYCLLSSLKGHPKCLINPYFLSWEKNLEKYLSIDYRFFLNKLYHDFRKWGRLYLKKCIPHSQCSIATVPMVYFTGTRSIILYPQPTLNNALVESHVSQRNVLSTWAGRLSVHRPRLAHRASSIETLATLNRVPTVLGTET